METTSFFSARSSQTVTLTSFSSSSAFFLPPPSFRSSSSSSSSSLLSSSIHREFLGFCSSSSLRSRARFRRKTGSGGLSSTRSPRFVVGASLDSGLIVVVLAVTTFSVAYFRRYYRKRNDSSKVSVAPESSHLGSDVSKHSQEGHRLDVGDKQTGKFVKVGENVVQKTEEHRNHLGEEKPFKIRELAAVQNDSVLTKPSDSEGIDSVSSTAIESALVKEFDATGRTLQSSSVLHESGTSSSHLGSIVTVHGLESQLLNVRDTYNGKSVKVSENFTEKTEEHRNHFTEEEQYRLLEPVVTLDDSFLTKPLDSSDLDTVSKTSSYNIVADASDATSDSELFTAETKMSERQTESCKQKNGLDSNVPDLTMEVHAIAPLCLVDETQVEAEKQSNSHQKLLEVSEANPYFNILTKSPREELHRLNGVSQPVVESPSFVGLEAVSPSPRSYSLHKTAPEPMRVELLEQCPLQTADGFKERFPMAHGRGGSSHEKKEVRRDTRHLVEQAGTSMPQFPIQNGALGNDKSHHPSKKLSAYNRLLRDGRLIDCLGILEDMEGRGLLNMDKIHHASFFKICKSQKAVKEAFRFAKLVPNPLLSTFNMLMSVCASSQDTEGALQVLELVQETGMRADCKLYTTLISTCAKSGKVDAMFEVFHKMVNSGVEPNVHTYGALIDGCARAGQVAKAFGAYGIMRSKKVKPDRVVFNALITACGRSGVVDRAFDVLAEMRAEAQPIDPDHITVGALMKACFNAGQVDRAKEVYNMLHDYNIRGTPEVYTIAVNCCSKTGDWEFACSIYTDMKSKGVTPDEVFFSALIDVAGHAGKLDTAFKLLQDAKAQGIHIGIISYSSLMGACCNAKNWQKAMELYGKIKSINLQPTVSTMNALITALCEGDQLPKAMEILYEMKNLGLSPNTITYSMLMAAIERKDDLEASIMLLSQAKEDGIAPNLTMSRCITSMCLRRFEKACTLGEPVLSFNSGRPKIENKWTSLALIVYREMILGGTKPTTEVVSQVMGCLRLPCDALLRDRLLENLGVTASSSRRPNLSSLVDGFGEYDPRAFSLLEEATSLGILPSVSFKESPIVVDATKLLSYTAEVYLLTIFKGLRHRLAAGAKLPNINMLLPVEETQITTPEGEKTINLAGRVSQAVTALLRRLGIPYQGNESYGKIRINGAALRRWFQPKLASPFSGKPEDLKSSQARLGKAIIHQQRNIRTGNLSL